MKTNEASEEKIYHYLKDNHSTVKETAKAFGIPRSRVDNIRSKYSLIEKRKRDPLYDYVGQKMRVYNALRRAGVQSMAQLWMLSRAELLAIPDIGEGALQEIYAGRNIIDFQVAQRKRRTGRR